MAVAFDAVGPTSAGQSATATTTTSWSHTCTGTNRLLVVGVAVGVAPDAAITTSATYGGTAMTSVGKVESNTGDNAGYVQMFRLIAPATGANTVAVTASATVDALSCGSVSFTGADQTTPLGTAATATGIGTAPSVAVPGTTSGNIVVDAVCSGTGTGITASGQTLRWKRNTNGNTAAGNGASSTAAGTGGSVTMSYTTGASDDYGLIAVEVKAAASGATLTGTAALAGTATITTAGFAVRPTGASLAGSATVAAAGFRTTLGGTSLAGTATLAAATQTQVGAASLAGTATVTTAGRRTAFGAASLAGSATVAAAASTGVAVKTGFNKFGVSAAIRAQICGSGGVPKTPARFINRSGVASQVS